MLVWQTGGQKKRLQGLIVVALATHEVQAFCFYKHFMFRGLTVCLFQVAMVDCFR
jgi:hypothetical protein